MLIWLVKDNRGTGLLSWSSFYFDGWTTHKEEPCESPGVSADVGCPPLRGNRRWEKVTMGPRMHGGWPVAVFFAHFRRTIDCFTDATRISPIRAAPNSQGDRRPSQPKFRVLEQDARLLAKSCVVSPPTKRACIFLPSSPVNNTKPGQTLFLQGRDFPTVRCCTAVIECERDHSSEF